VDWCLPHMALGRRRVVYHGRMRVARLAPALMAILFAAPAWGQRLNVDFGTSWGTPVSAYGAVLQIGTWNEAGLGTTPLVDLAGAVSDVSVTVAATSDGGNHTSDGSNGALLLADNFYEQNIDWSADLSGLAPGSYRVVLYAPSNASVPTGAMMVGGVPVASLPGSTDSDLIEGTSWDEVVVLTTDGTLAISGGGGVFTGLAGLQIAPEPVCADGIVQGDEECEDGNAAPGDGCYSTCQLEDELLISGEAEGGSVDLSVFGVLLTTTTTPGQSAASIASALAAEVNADAILGGLGVSAVALGGRLFTNGSIDGLDLADAGLAQCPAPVPALDGAGTAVLAAALLVCALVMLRIRRRAVLASLVVLALVGPHGTGGASAPCKAHPTPNDSGLGVAHNFDFAPDNTVSEVLVSVHRGYLRSWVAGHVAVDITITSVDGLNHFHGTDVVPLTNTTVFDASFPIADVIVPWTEDDVSMVVNDLYTICSQLLIDGVPPGPEFCVAFGPF